jgi:hypothetical protein
MHEGSNDEQEIVGTARIQEGADDGGNDRQVRVIWAAGFFDGEGAISLPKNKNGTRYLRIGIGQLHLPSLQIIQELFGGTINPEQFDNGKTFWRWQANNHVGADALRTMLPWLIVKGEQAEFAVEFWDGKPARARIYQDKRHAVREGMRRFRKGEKADPDIFRAAQEARRDTESKRGDDFMRQIVQARL